MEANDSLRLWRGLLIIARRWISSFWFPHYGSSRLFWKEKQKKIFPPPPTSLQKSTLVEQACAFFFHGTNEVGADSHVKHPRRDSGRCDKDLFRYTRLPTIRKVYSGLVRSSFGENNGAKFFCFTVSGKRYNEIYELARKFVPRENQYGCANIISAYFRRSNRQFSPNSLCVRTFGSERKVAASNSYELICVYQPPAASTNWVVRSIINYTSAGLHWWSPTAPLIKTFERYSLSWLVGRKFIRFSASDASLIEIQRYVRRLTKYLASSKS